LRSIAFSSSQCGQGSCSVTLASCSNSDLSQQECAQRRFHVLLAEGGCIGELAGMAIMAKRARLDRQGSQSDGVNARIAGFTGEVEGSAVIALC